MANKHVLLTYYYYYIVQLRIGALCQTRFRVMQALIRDRIRLLTRVATIAVRNVVCIAREATCTAMLLCVPMRHMQALLQHEIRVSTRIATLCVRHGTCIARKATYKAMLLCVVCVPMLPCCYQNYYTFQLQRESGLYEARSG